MLVAKHKMRQESNAKELLVTVLFHWDNIPSFLTELNSPKHAEIPM